MLQRRIARICVLFLALTCFIHIGIIHHWNAAAAQPAGALDGAGRLTLLHTNDGGSASLPQNMVVATATGPVTLPVGGLAAYATRLNQQRIEGQATGAAVLHVYAGGALAASAALNCALPPAATTPVYDAIGLQQVATDAHLLASGELSYGPQLLKRFISAIRSVSPGRPFLSANLDASGEPTIAPLIGSSTIVTDTTTGQRFGIVGVSEPDMSLLVPTGNLTFTTTLTATAQATQAAIDHLYDGEGVRKIVLLSHLNGLAQERALQRLLRRVDVVVAGGGNELLANPTISPTLQLLPGEAGKIEGRYPETTVDADGRVVYLVTTPGRYRYLGRLDIAFDAAGEVEQFDATTSALRRVIPIGSQATALGIDDAVAPDQKIRDSAVDRVDECLEPLAAPIVARSEIAFDIAASQLGRGETNGGDLVADALLAAYNRYGPAAGLLPNSSAHPMIALHHAGGIGRNAGDRLPTGATLPGSISRLNAVDLLPFDHSAVVLEGLSAADLRLVFEHALAALPAASGQFLQIAGLQVTYDPSSPAGGRVRDITLADGRPLVRAGTPVSDAPTIAVITNSLLARGGYGFAILNDHPATTLRGSNDLPLLLGQSLQEYLRSFPLQDSFPRIPATDPRYQPGGTNRLQALVTVLLPFVVRE